MIGVLALAALIWWGGRALGLEPRLRISALGILCLAVISFHIGLPPEHPLRRSTGGSLANWLILAALTGIVLAYRAVLAHLRGRIKTPPPPKKGTFETQELDRYARHIVLREIGGPGQKKLKAARILVIGAGGLGAPALQYLAAAGVGTIGIIDDDVVELSNLQRQVIHTDQRIGQPKVFSAVEAMRAINPHITLKPYHRRLTADIAPDLFAAYDLLLDGTDNFETRYFVNRTCVTLGLPLISAAITQWEGQISLYHPARGAPCYACAFPKAPDPALAPDCAEAGVMGALPGVVGAMMAVEAIKWITGAGETLAGRLMLYDALYAQTRIIACKRNPDCPVCRSGL